MGSFFLRRGIFGTVYEVGGGYECQRVLWYYYLILFVWISFCAAGLRSEISVGFAS